VCPPPPTNPVEGVIEAKEKRDQQGDADGHPRDWRCRRGGELAPRANEDDVDGMLEVVS